jgi:hypothetical protein
LAQDYLTGLQTTIALLKPPSRKPSETPPPRPFDSIIQPRKNKERHDHEQLGRTRRI